MSCNFSHRIFVTVVIYVILRVYVAKKITHTLTSSPPTFPLCSTKDDSLLGFNVNVEEQTSFCFEMVILLLSWFLVGFGVADVGGDGGISVVGSSGGDGDGSVVSIGGGGGIFVVFVVIGVVILLAPMGCLVELFSQVETIMSSCFETGVDFFDFTFISLFSNTNS